MGKRKCKKAHRWDHPPDYELFQKKVEQGQAKCLDCQKVWGTRPSYLHRPNYAPQPKGVTPGSSIPASEPVKWRNEALRAKWGFTSPKSAGPVQPDPAGREEAEQEEAEQEEAEQEEAEQEKKKTAKKVDLAEILREEVPDLIIVAEQTTIEWCGRIPNDPSAKLEAKLKESVNRVLEAKMPKIEVSPLAAAGITAALLWGQMFVGAEKKTKKTKPPTGNAPADAKQSPEVSTQSPPSSPPIPPLSLVPGNGSADDAAQSVLDD